MTFIDDDEERMRQEKAAAAADQTRLPTSGATSPDEAPEGSQLNIAKSRTPNQARRSAPRMAAEAKNENGEVRNRAEALSPLRDIERREPKTQGPAVAQSYGTTKAGQDIEATEKAKKAGWIRRQLDKREAERQQTSILFREYLRMRGQGRGREAAKAAFVSRFGYSGWERIAPAVARFREGPQRGPGRIVEETTTPAQQTRIRRGILPVGRAPFRPAAALVPRAQAPGVPRSSLFPKTRVGLFPKSTVRLLPTHTIPLLPRGNRMFFSRPRRPTASQAAPAQPAPVVTQGTVAVQQAAPATKQAPVRRNIFVMKPMFGMGPAFVRFPKMRKLTPGQASGTRKTLYRTEGNKVMQANVPESEIETQVRPKRKYTDMIMGFRSAPEKSIIPTNHGFNASKWAPRMPTMKMSDAKQRRKST